jgi:hypothetical protein
MPDATDQCLEQLLAYDDALEPANDLFVTDVMRGLRRERRLRRAILLGCGGVGALFGVAGAVMLSVPIGRLFTDALPAFGLAQAALFTVGGLAFYAWFMNDDLALER